ncbi:regulatory subunit for Cdc7p protein kinase, partial [Lecanoromycetidae sp. Uapishka_2]
MNGKRVPLGNVPNAANSPFRAVAAAASKRSREQVEQQEDLQYDFQPRAKRQALANVEPTAFERRLLAAREDKALQKVEKQEKPSTDTLDTIRQWQKHYKKSFPLFVFYFESVPEDVRQKCSKWIRQLGAREEKFFSKEVTHVVTTRPTPTHNDSRDATDSTMPSSTSTSSQGTGQPRTINPALLDRQQDTFGQPLQSKNKFTFEAPGSKRTLLNGLRESEPRKGNTGNTDMLLKADQMGMKIWQLEKLQRIMNTMSNIPSESQVQGGNTGRTKGANAAAQFDRAADLSRMLRDERLHGPSDRDASIALNELIPFKGHYIYIRDIDERSKPIMVRDYPKAGQGEDGDWPQFHSVAVGKCPFVPDVDLATRRELQRERAREDESRASAKADTQPAPRTRAATSRQDAEVQSAKFQVPQRRPLQEVRDRVNITATEVIKPTMEASCPRPPIAGTKVISPSKAARDAAHPTPKLFGGEPAASGMQPSNITSAIQSQMISSTAAQPGAKAGTSKEVHGLKRKVLEKNSAPALNQIQTRQKSLDPSGNGRAERTIPPYRWTRNQTQRPMTHIDEESTQSEEDEDVWLAQQQQEKKMLKKASEKKEPKPGYCENCREKYDDFDDHIVGRKHRKFALTADNWKDLDKLLVHLGRQLKQPDFQGS